MISFRKSAALALIIAILLVSCLSWVPAQAADRAGSRDLFVMPPDEVSDNIMHTIIMQINNSDTYINSEERNLETLLPTINDSTHLPLRFVAKSANSNVEYEQAMAMKIGLLLNHFVFNIVEVSGSAMAPTLHASDRLIVLSRYISKIENGDIIVFRPINDPKRPYIKRVIAVGGQKVDINKDGRVIVDGKMLEESYVSQYRSTHGDMQFPLKVADGTFFVMGDNRPNSKDSRFKEVGLVKLDAIIGKVILRWYPFDQFTAF